MADYLHGAYGQIQAVGSRVSTDSMSAIVYVGTAPVHMVAGGAETVNKPILVSNIAEAKKKLGYSDDFASFTLCEAMHVHFNHNAVGPLVLINVLDPKKHIAKQSGSVSLTPEKGRVTIVAAEKIILDTVVVKAGSDTKVKGTDYSISCNVDKKTIVISEMEKGSLGTDALTITYQEIDPSAVTTEDVIGASDGFGRNTGVYAVQNVYQETGFIPSFLAAPGFSSIPDIHDALAENSVKINGHWDAYMLVDIPIFDEEKAVTLSSAAEWKNENGYTKENETVYFPMAAGTDGKKYHLSVLAAANLQVLLSRQDGIPYRTASNTECSLIENLYLGESEVGRVYDDTLINKVLNRNGIASAAFVGGHWVIWGAHSADYDQENANSINVAETNRMMLYYISNDFQRRRSNDVDKHLTVNDMQSIVAEEQARLDALVKIGALIYGEVELNAEQEAMSDIMNGDFSITFRVTATPLAKSLTAVVNWAADKFTTYFESFAGQ